MTIQPYEGTTYLEASINRSKGLEKSGKAEIGSGIKVSILVFQRLVIALFPKSMVSVVTKT